MKNLEHNLVARFLVRIVVYSLLGLFFLEFDPFDIGDKSDQATQDALYKIAAPYYLSKAQQDIVVVLINQPAIRELYQRQAIEANEWPIRYRDHAYLLSRILKHQPKSVFVDIYFKQERSTDDSFKQFMRQTDRLSKKYKTPLLFAGGYRDEQCTAIQNQLNGLGGLVVSGWQDYDKAYPLSDHGRLTVAYRLYQQACLSDSPLHSCQKPLLDTNAVGAGLAFCSKQNIRVDEEVASDAVSVRWGSRPGTVLFPEFSNAVCKDNSNSWWEVGRQMVFGLFEDLINANDEAASIDALCAYHSVIYADELVFIDKSGSDEQKQKVAAALKGKIVMYALSLEGLHDNVYSPVHGQLPGVFFHAMALDNLIHYGADYVHASDELSEKFNRWIWLAMTLAFSGLLFFYERKGIRFSDESNMPDDNVKPECRLSAFRLFVAASVSIFALSLGMYFWKRYEPLNSIGFLVLVGVASWLVRSDFAGMILRLPATSFQLLIDGFACLVRKKLVAETLQEKFISWQSGKAGKAVKVKNMVAYIKSSNLDEADAFYQGIFGLELVMESDWKKTYSANSEAAARVSIVSKGRLGAPVADLSIEVDDFEITLKRIQKAGIKIEYGPEPNDCEVRRFYIRDPSKKLVRVFQYKKKQCFK